MFINGYNNLGGTMDYKQIKKDNYTLHLIETDRFKTTRISIRFTKKYKSL